MSELDLPETTSIRWSLRTACADLHACVDARLSSLIARGEAGYIAFLRMVAAAVIPLEQGLVAAGVGDILPDWEERSRSEALLADLADFGVVGRPSQSFPAFDGEAQLLGVLYVLEGSRLGAQLLVRQILADGGAASQSAMRFLRHGAGQQLWPKFLECLETSVAVRRSPDATIGGARTAFAWFRGTPQALSPVHPSSCADEARYGGP
jgi:heme oxygenase